MKKIIIIMLILTVNLFSLGNEKEFNILTNEIIELEESLTGESFFEFKIDESIFGIKIILESEVDLELFLNHDSIVDESKKEIVKNGNKKILTLTRVSAFKLFNGTYFGTVVYDKFKAPIINGKESKIIPYKLIIETIGFPQVETIKIDEEVNLKLNKNNDWTKFFKIKTTNFKQLKIDTYNPESDIDLYVFYNKLNYDYQTATYKAETFAGTESIIIDNNSSPKFRNGTYYIMIVDKYSLYSEKNLTIKVSNKKTTNINLNKEIKKNEPKNEMEKIVYSTVSIICSEKVGTGFFVSKNGLVITASHVIKNSDYTLSNKIIVAVNVDTKTPPKELFYAKVVYIDEKMDLALLEIDKFIYSNINLNNYVVNYLPVKKIEAKFGDEVLAFGYPASGGSSSKNSIRVTKGIVSGFEKKDNANFIISDVKVDLGNSGGPLLDTNYNLVGVVTEILQSEITNFSSVFPIISLPKKWMDRIEK